jgi:hypothetical protein
MTSVTVRPSTSIATTCFFAPTSAPQTYPNSNVLEADPSRNSIAPPLSSVAGHVH